MGFVSQSLKISKNLKEFDGIYQKSETLNKSWGTNPIAQLNTFEIILENIKQQQKKTESHKPKNLFNDPQVF